jgi:hypothetical protein
MDIALSIALGLLRIVGNVETLRLQLGNGGRELRNRSADVRQLDDVGIRRLGKLTQLRQRITDALFVRQVFRECCKNAACQGDIAGLDVDARRIGERLDDREQGIRGQGRRPALRRFWYK